MKLSATNAQIDQSKGSSLLDAVQIRANINALGGGAATTAVAGRSSQVLQSVSASGPTGNESGITSTARSGSLSPVPVLLEQSLFENVQEDLELELAGPANLTLSGSAAELVWMGFRHWIDAI